MAKHSLYDSNPHMEHDEHGKVQVKKSEKASSEHKDSKEEGGAESDNLPVHAGHMHARRAMHHKHMKEHLDLHHQHEHEHLMYKGDTKALHTKHHKEYGEMHARHHAEMKSMHTQHEKMGHTSGGQSTVDQPIEKVEKGAHA